MASTVERDDSIEASVREPEEGYREPVLTKPTLESSLLLIVAPTIAAPTEWDMEREGV